ncbi:hypothetical protein ACFOY8_14140 [Thalassospira xianhensis]|uniref:Uncharacterized protein n=2 Tax=Thalassospira TaxID=168934 RepID=A0A285TSK6_9PROT|nr:MULTISPECIES: hypothetical protein [Thalassospira]RCK07703.1 hypothetical protein TH5_01125 [Thalassospira xianhensis MCCC 1A02616]SOC26483.1 hypothetical protein SAMN05428964_105123 [Thalassospira xiamenensis]
MSNTPAIRKPKGYRKIVVHGRTFFWKVGHDFHQNGIVHILSTDPKNYYRTDFSWCLNSSDDAYADDSVIGDSYSPVYPRDVARWILGNVPFEGVGSVKIREPEVIGRGHRARRRPATSTAIKRLRKAILPSRPEEDSPANVRPSLTPYVAVVFAQCSDGNEVVTLLDSVHQDMSEGIEYVASLNRLVAAYRKDSGRLEKSLNSIMELDVDPERKEYLLQKKRARFERFRPLRADEQKMEQVIGLFEKADNVRFFAMEAVLA